MSQVVLLQHRQEAVAFLAWQALIRLLPKMPDLVFSERSSVYKAPWTEGALKHGLSAMRGQVTVQVLLRGASLWTKHAGERLHRAVKPVVMLLKVGLFQERLLTNLTTVRKAGLAGLEMGRLPMNLETLS